MDFKKVFLKMPNFYVIKNIGFLVNCEKDLEFLGKSSGYSDEIKYKYRKIRNFKI